mgnify:CR=1 FL=1
MTARRVSALTRRGVLAGAAGWAACLTGCGRNGGSSETAAPGMLSETRLDVQGVMLSVIDRKDRNAIEAFKQSVIAHVCEHSCCIKISFISYFYKSSN